MPRQAVIFLAVAVFACVLSAEEKSPNVIRRYDFDAGDKAGAEATNQGTAEIEEEDTFDGEGRALRVSNDKTYLGVSWYQREPIEENGTTVCFAYKVAGIKGNLFVQCGSEGAGNLHADIKSTVQGEWAVAVVDMGKLVDWGGKYTDSRGHRFRNLQVYGGLKGGRGVLILDNIVVYEGRDGTPPEAPRELTACIEDFRVRVSWARAGEETFVSRYDVYRGTAPEFTPSEENLVGSTRRLFIHDDTISNFGTFYYKVRAVDAAGNEGPPSAPFRLDIAGMRRT